MKIFSMCLPVMVLTVVAVTVLAHTGHAVEFYAAPAGNDANPGTQSKPFASFYRAQEAARNARKTNSHEGVTVNFSSGIYLLKRPMEFTPSDSGVSTEQPVCYRAQSGAEAIISGGQTINGWQPDLQRPGIWKTRITNSVAEEGEPWRFDQLWVNGQLAIRARTPGCQDFAALDRVVEQPDGGGSEAVKHTYFVPPEMLVTLRGLSEEELRDVQVVVFQKWDTAREFLTTASPSAGTFTTRGVKLVAWNKLEKGCLFYLENWLGALDSPGEWFLDRHGWLYYWPRAGEDMTQAAVVAPTIDQFLSVRGDEKNRVQHLRFDGLKFRYAGFKIPVTGMTPAQAAINVDATSIEIDHASDIQFTNCAIEHVGSTGIWFRHDCQDCRIVHTRLFDLGVSGVRIGETEVVPQKVRTARITVDNCIIQSGGRIRPDAAAVWIGQSGDNVVRHCDISDFFYSGISVGWCWGYGKSVAQRNQIEYNHIHHLGYRILSDMGGIYTLGKANGTVVRNNVIHDIYAGSYGGWGLYADEGTSGILYENNLIYNVMDGGFHQHYGETNIIRNNIFAFSEDGQIAVSRVEPHVSFTFEHNLVYWEKDDLLGQRGWKNGAKVVLHDNLYWHTAGQAFDFAGKTWEQWRAKGNDHGSIIADPLFVNAARRDFRLQPDSPAGKIGFQTFDPAEAGVYGEPAWKKLAAGRNLPPPFVAPAPKPIEFQDDFENEDTSPLLKITTLHEGDHAGQIIITNDPSASSNHCLQLLDRPGLQFAYEPYFTWDPGYTTGRAHLYYKIWLDPNADANCEWRDRKPNNFTTGPSIEFKRGFVLVQGRQLLAIPTNTWISVDMRTQLGQRNARWELALKLPGGEWKEINDLPCNPKWTEARLIVFSSLATNRTVFYLDDMKMENH